MVFKTPTLPEKTIQEKFYGHPQIKSLSASGKNPSYIAAGDFASVLLDLFTNSGSNTPTKPDEYMIEMEKEVSALPDANLKQSLLALIKNAKMLNVKAEDQMAAIRKGFEGWFNSSMDRANGWYKRYMAIVGLIVGLFLAGIFNADAIGITQVLWRDSSLRAVWSNIAVLNTTQGKSIDPADILKIVQGSPLPIGWSGAWEDGKPETPYNPQDFPITFGGWFLKVGGILLTGFAASQGSPIWFDLIGKIVNVRGTGKVPEKQDDKGS